MDQKVSYKNILIVAGSYIATLIGSGYATGQEILQFFVSYGIKGIFISIVVTLIYTLLALECLERGRLTRPKNSMRMYQFYGGNYLGTFFEYFVLVFLFAVNVVMIAGSGDTLKEYYGLNPYVGRVLMAAVVFGTVSMGLMKLANIIGNIGPVIIVFVILVGVLTLIKVEPSSIIEGSKFVSEKIASGEMNPPIPTKFFYFVGFNYASYNVIVVLAYLAELGKVSNSKKENILASIAGGFGLGLAAIVMYLAMLSRASDIYNQKIPILVLADDISPLLGKFVCIIVLLGIYTTAVTLTWQVSDRIFRDGTPNFKWAVLGITVLSLACGFVSFDKLINFIYPKAGFVGLILLVIMFVKYISLKSDNSTGIEEMRKYTEIED